jgi:hypothetical protein
VTPSRISRSPYLNRRNFLRTTALGAPAIIGLPLFHHLLNSNGDALANGDDLPRRFGIFFWGNGRGIIADRWNPAETGTNYTLSPQLAPLAAYQDYLNVVTGMRVLLNNSPQGHHRGTVGILSGRDFIAQEPGNGPYRSTFAGPSIDQMIATELGDITPFRSLEVGISERLIRGEGSTLQFLSHNGPDNTNPPEYNPVRLFERIFAVTPPPDSEDPGIAEAMLSMKKSVLDNAAGEISALKQRVGARDRERLDQHLTNIRDIERRLTGIVTAGEQCVLPDAPAPIANHPSGEALVERMLAMSELLALALACDVTRVFSIHFSGSAANPVYHQIGLTQGHHQLSHELDAQEEIDHSTIFTMEQLAVLLRALAQVPEGDRDLLYQSSILATSDTSDGAAHSVNDYPIVIAGSGGGHFKSPGVHFRSDRENTSKVLLSLVRSMNIPATEFGAAGGHVTASCSEIEA